MLTLAGLFVLVVCVLLGALNLAMPLIAGPTPTATARATPSRKPTWTPIVAATRALPSPTASPTPTLVLQEPTPTTVLSEADDTILAKILEATLSELGYPSQCMFYEVGGRRVLSVLTSTPRPNADSLGFVIAAISEFTHGLLATRDDLQTIVLVVEDTSGDEQHWGIKFDARDASAFFTDDLTADEFLATWQTVTDADLP